MKIVRMKKHLLTGIIAIIVTLVFAGGLCVAVHSDCNRILFGAVLGVAWLISLGLLFSTVYSRKRRGHIIIDKHFK